MNISRHYPLPLPISSTIPVIVQNASFGQGMTDDDEADLWQKDLTCAIELWIDVGMPEEKLIRKACGRVVEMWFAQNSSQFERLKNLTVINLPVESTRAIAKMAQRNMRIHCTIQDGQVWLGNGDESVMIELVTLKTPPPP